MQPQVFQVKIEFTTSQPYQKMIKYDNLVFVRPQVDFYRLLHIVRPVERFSGLLSHIQPDLFK